MIGESLFIQQNKKELNKFTKKKFIFDKFLKKIIKQKVKKFLYRQYKPRHLVTQLRISK